MAFKWHLNGASWSRPKLLTLEVLVVDLGCPSFFEEPLWVSQILGSGGSESLESGSVSYGVRA